MRDFISKDELDREVLYLISQHIGRQNAVGRWDLVEQIFGEKQSNRDDGNSLDRRMRDSIERLRGEGHIICNMGDRTGYYVASNVEEYQEFRLLYGAHAFPIMATIREMDRAASQKWPNPLQPALM